ncbi:putative ATPase [Streptomonospora salina]|uniref:Putative ATPase n=2 Tax=Streptomonospora salina TaxID=104205 RepID=A0A841E7I1_9ACTN|nr:putative ATPase [Streptomonospora salina]
MPAREIRAHGRAAASGATVFFDRGVVDVAGYLRVEGRRVPQHVHSAALRFRYDRTVFIAPPWSAIYRTGTERAQTFAQAERIYAAMVSACTDYGYDLVELPRSSVPERARFVVDRSPE